jgi:methionine-rich copper-binding protein CopC
MVSRALPLYVLVGAIALLVAAGAAEAHAALQLASPRVGSGVARSPAEVRMWFSETLEPAFSRAQLLGPSAPEAAGKAVVDPSDRRQLVLPVTAPLPAGRYQVKWAVVSADGHRTEGDFGFSVAPAGAPSALKGR